MAIVDDEVSILKAMGRFLRSTGLAVETFESGAEFLDAAKGKQPDCVVLDLHMPAVSGVDVQAELLRRDPRVPIIVITGHDSPGLRERVLGAGAARYLRKPVDGDLLLSTITSLVSL